MSTYDPSADVITVGRATNMDVCLPLPSVSKFHACFTGSRHGWKITDESATNGTFVDDTRLARGGSTWLREGSRVAFGPGARGRFFTAKGLYVLLCGANATRGR